jgi:hypothetical protein
VHLRAIWGLGIGKTREKHGKILLATQAVFSNYIRFVSIGGYSLNHPWKRGAKIPNASLKRMVVG